MEVLTEDQFLKLQKSGNLPTLDTEFKLEKHNIPDPNWMSQQIIQILEVMNQPAMIELKSKNPIVYTNQIATLFPEFADRHYSILKILQDDDLDSIDYLLDFLGQLKKIKNNEIEPMIAFNTFADKLNHEMIYDKFGGKEAFEKKIAEEKTKNKKKKKN